MMVRLASRFCALPLLRRHCGELIIQQLLRFRNRFARHPATNEAAAGSQARERASGAVFNHSRRCRRRWTGLLICRFSAVAVGECGWVHLAIHAHPKRALGKRRLAVHATAKRDRLQSHCRAGRGSVALIDLLLQRKPALKLVGLSRRLRPRQQSCFLRFPLLGNGGLAACESQAVSASGWTVHGFLITALTLTDWNRRSCCGHLRGRRWHGRHYCGLWPRKLHRRRSRSARGASAAGGASKCLASAPIQRLRRSVRRHFPRERRGWFLLCHTLRNAHHANLRVWRL